jgi:hypothetical protein
MTPRRALVIGINNYRDPGNDLQGCVTDAEAITERLARNTDGTPNYDCDDHVHLARVEDNSVITRAELRKRIYELFSNFKGETLLYFSGHGALNPFGGWLCTSDAEKNDLGISVEEVLKAAQDSNASDVLLMFDCCHSGSVGDAAVFQSPTAANKIAVLRENLTIIAASTAVQAAAEAGGHGLFTAAVLDALDGGAADHMGWVTSQAIFAYVQRRFGAWGQSPVYKSHTTQVNVVRKCAPLINRYKLEQLVHYFPDRNSTFLLDPEFEPEDEHGNVKEPVNKEKVAIAKLFKEYRDAGLLRPCIDGEQLFWTARHGHAVRLTTRGEEYWWLVRNKKI